LVIDGLSLIMVDANVAAIVSNDIARSRYDRQSDLPATHDLPTFGAIVRPTQRAFASRLLTSAKLYFRKSAMGAVRGG
jgi:hypothetical protein